MSDSTNDNSGQNSDQASAQESPKKSNDFVVGLVTFIVFLLFMTAWMYFSAT